MNSDASEPSSSTHNLLALLLDNVHDAIIAADNTFTITYWNRTAEARFGWQAAEAVGKNFHALLEAEISGAELFSGLPSLESPGKLSRRAVLRHKNGEQVSVDATILRPTAGSGEAHGYMITLSDITAQERLLGLVEDQKASIQQKNHMLAGMIESTSDFIAAIDTGYRFTTMNRAYREEYRRLYGKEISVGDRVHDVLAGSPEDQRRALGLWERALSGESFRVTEIFGSGEQRRAVDISFGPIYTQNGEIAGAAQIAMDATARTHAEEALRESESHFRYLADALPQLVWTARADGAVDYYNQRYKEYSGIARAENGVWEWGPVLHPDDVQHTVDAWKRAIAAGTVYQAEHRVQMRDGAYRWHLSRGFPVHGADGKVVRWFGTATDIHDLKQADSSMKEYAERLAQSNQDLQNFAFIASHDLQEPLRKIVGFGEVLKHSLDSSLDAESRDILERMQSAANRMQEMIRGLLELSRVNTHGQSFTPVDLNTTAAEVISDLEPMIQRSGGQVTVDPLPPIFADPLQIRQLLQNLIANALKFHQPGRPPRVRVSASIQRADLAGEEQVLLQVQDNGVGFDEQYFERILEPFQRLHGRGEYEGTGMGLAIVRRIVERHHGKIRAASRLGEGTTFEISLPARP